MGWLDDAKRIIEEQERFEQRSSSRLYIKSSDSIPEKFDGIKSILFQFQYSGLPLEDMLPGLLSRAKDLEQLHISGPRLPWQTVCSFDLSRIVALTLALDGPVTEGKIDAPRLKRLCVFGAADLTPMEQMINPIPHIDFSGMPSLEVLELRHFQQVDPTDFQNVSSLKKLIITESDIAGLDWLQHAKYQLEMLCIPGSVADCGGVVYQPGLKELLLHHNYVRDASPIEQLKQLEKLDLLHGGLQDEGNLRKMGIKELIITRADYDAANILRATRDLVRKAAMRYLAQNKQCDRIDEIPESNRKHFLRMVEQPFDIRMMRLVQAEFNYHLREFDKEKPLWAYGASIPKEECRRRFIASAMEYCPFLSADSYTFDLIRMRGSLRNEGQCIKSAHWTMESFAEDTNSRRER